MVLDRVQALTSGEVFQQGLGLDWKRLVETGSRDAGEESVKYR